MESVEGFTDLVLSEGFEDYENGQVPLSAIALVESRDAAIRAECAERALVFYCQEVCFEDGEKENAICRRRGGCKWANQLRAAIMAEPPKVAL